MGQAQFKSPDSDSCIMPSKLALLNYHHQTQSGLHAGFQTSTLPEVRTEPGLIKTYTPAPSKSQVAPFPSLPVTSLSPDQTRAPGNMNSYNQSERRQQTPPKMSQSLRQNDFRSVQSPVSVLSLCSDQESLDSYASSQTTAVSDRGFSNSKSTVLQFPSRNTSLSPDYNDAGEAIEEMNFDADPNSPIPLRKTKISVLDRPRPIARARNSTFSAPHAESDRLVQTVLKNSKSFDRGRRYWLAPPAHVSAPPVPAIPSAFDKDKKVKRQSSMIDISSNHYEALANGGSASEAMFDRSTRLFDERAPSLVLTDPSIYESTPTISSAPRRQFKDVIPQSLRKLKPKKSAL